MRKWILVALRACLNFYLNVSQRYCERPVVSPFLLPTMFLNNVHLVHLHIIIYMQEQKCFIKINIKIKWVDTKKTVPMETFKNLVSIILIFEADKSIGVCDFKW